MREDVTLTDACESVARAETDDPDICKKAVEKGQLKNKGVGAFVVANGTADFKQCSRDEALANMRPRRGARLFLVSDGVSGAAGRMMKCVEGQGMPRLKNPFDFGNLFLILKIEFPAPGALSEAAQAALIEAVPRRLSAPTTDEAPAAAEVELFTTKDLDPLKSYNDNKPQPEEDDDEERRGPGGVQCAQS